MGAPAIDIYQMTMQNEHASMPLVIPLVVLCNTPDEEIHRNIKVNSAKPLQWLQKDDVHGEIAVFVGGGPSVADYVEDIRSLQSKGATIFAINAASKWLRERGIVADWQVTCDAQERTATLVDPEAKGHLFASQVAPATMEAAPSPIVWHLEIGDVERLLPQEKVKRGGYALIGGGASSGNSALCIGYCMGYREMHIFGYDSSHRAGKSHAYEQPMNAGIPVLKTTWAGKEYLVGVAMKAQAEKFVVTGQALEQLGCRLNVHGDGLLPDMWNTPPSNLTEQDVYRRMWMEEDYRIISPGEMLVNEIAEFCKTGPLLDFGCGTGRAGIKLAEMGYQVTLIDFAENCRDDAALSLSFLMWDLSRPCPLRAPYGYCCDVMEHIPAEQVDDVLKNLSEACSEGVFFRISHELDGHGPAFIGRQLHLTVHGPNWWIEKLQKHWPHVEHKGDGIFLASKGA